MAHFRLKIFSESKDSSPQITDKVGNIPIFRQIALSEFQFKMPLETIHGKTRVQCISVKPKIGNVQVILQNLLWHCLFGKQFKTIHWYILFRVISRIKTKDPVALGIFSSLMFSFTPRGGTYKLNKNMKSAKTNMDRFDSECNNSQSTIKEVLTLLSTQLQLPKKNQIQLDDLFSVTSTFIVQRKPEDPRRIGVGYKDQGSLGTPGQEYDPTESTWNPASDISVWDELSRNFKKMFPKYHNFRN